MLGFMDMLETPVELPEVMVVFRRGMLKDGAAVLRCYWTSASWLAKSCIDRFFDWGFKRLSARPLESIPTNRHGEKDWTYSSRRGCSPE